MNSAAATSRNEASNPEHQALLAKLKPLRDRLMDLTMRNRQLNYRDFGAQGVPLCPADPQALYDALVENDESLKVQGLDMSAEEETKWDEACKSVVGLMMLGGDSTADLNRRTLICAASVKKTEARMNGMYRKYKECLEAFGANLCYMALGFLEWSDPAKSSEETICSPLILVPVAISRQTQEINGGGLTARNRRVTGPSPRSYAFTVSHDGEDVVDNVALRLKLARTTLAPVLPEFDSEAEGDVVNDYLEQVESLLESLPGESTAGWSVIRTARIAFFASSKEAMYRDLDPEIWPGGLLPEKEWIKAAVNGGDPAAPSNVSDEEVVKAIHVNPVPTVTDADSSQMRALVRVAKGESIVIQGPPGTGKSQSITNLIATALHQGKSVLFMSEKMAALSVVRDRLEKAGLGQFCLELHSAKATPKAVLEQVKRRLKFPVVAPDRGPGNAAADRDRLNRHRHQLEQYGGALKSILQPHGVTLEDAIWRQGSLREELRRMSGLDPDEVRVPRLGETVPDAGTLDRLMDALKVAALCVTEGVPAAAQAWQGLEPRFLPGADMMEALAALLADADTLGRRWGAAEADLPAPLKWQGMPAGHWLDLTRNPLLPEPREIPQVMVAAVLRSEEHRHDYRAYLDAMRAWRAVEDAEARLLSQRLTVTEEEIMAAGEAAVRLLRSPSARLGFTTYGEMDFRKQELDWLLEVIEGRDALLDVIASHLGVGRGPRLMDGEELCAAVAKLGDLAPSGWDALHPCLLRPGSEAALEKAIGRSSVLNAELSTLRSVLHVDIVPDSEAVASVLEEVRRTAGGWFNWVPGTRGQKARRTLRGWTAGGGKFHEQAAAGLLEQLCQWRRDAQGFKVDRDLTQLLGPTFAGLETDWTAQQAARETVAVMRQKLGPTGAAAVLGRKDDVLALIPETLAHSEATGQYLSDVLDMAARLLNEPEDRVRGYDTAYLAGEVRTFRDQAHRDLGILEKLGVSHQAAARDLREICLTALRLRSHVTAVERLVAGGELLADLHQGMSATSLDPVAEGLDYLEAVLDHAQLGSEAKTWLLDAAPAEKVRSVHEGIQRVADAALAADTRLGGLQEWFDVNPAAVPSAESFRKLAPDHLCDWVTRSQGALDILHGWYRLVKREREIRELGAEGFWNWCKQKGLEPDVAVCAARFSFLTQVLRECERVAPHLLDHHRQELQEEKEGFSRLDKVAATSGVAAIQQQVLQRRKTVRPGAGAGSPKNFTELALLNHEIGKMRRHVPVRRLVRQSHHALQNLMPCWMLGPQAVAQFLPPGAVEFDLLVVDEASQVRPEDALGSLARAKQIVIVGDSKQMPPTDVFKSVGIDIDEDEESEEGFNMDSAALQLESVLDVFGRQLGAQSLEWHYRSLHQSLISFSNENFYDSRLVVPPSRWHDGEDFGVKHHFLEDGRLQNRCNPAEAEFVVKLMREHVLKESGKPAALRETLGVVSMNATQQDMIADKWERACRGEPDLENALAAFELAAPIFIRNLENVQGDERDVIIASFTYGRSAANEEPHQRFGPVNKVGGWRRLNVLFTRAKKRFHVVTSLRHTDVKIDLNGSDRGKGYFRKYLQFAETGHLPDTGTGKVRKTPESPFEVAVGRAIEGLGFDIHYQVGVQGFRIDIGIVDPDSEGSYLCGIECDGAAYHSHPISRDRDRIRQEILEMRGWKIFRIWSTDWYRNNREYKNRLKDYLNGLMKR